MVSKSKQKGSRSKEPTPVEGVRAQEREQAEPADRADEPLHGRR